MPAQLTYAHHAPSGAIIHVSDAANGAACDCICPGCDRPLIAKQGDRLEWHFAHEGDACEGAIESALHRAAKQVVARARSILLPARDFPPLPKSDPRSFDYHGASEETPLGERRPDVLTWADVDGKRHHLLVEIKVTHAVDDAKRAYLMLNELPCIEITLDPKDAERLSDPGELRAEVLERAPRSWIYHPHMKTAARRRHEMEVADRRAEIDGLREKIQEMTREPYRAAAKAKEEERAAWTEAETQRRRVDRLSLRLGGLETIQHLRSEDAELTQRLRILQGAIAEARAELADLRLDISAHDPARSPDLPANADEAADVWWDPTHTGRAA